MNLFEKFLEEKKYSLALSPKTVKTYQCANVAYQRIVGDRLPTKQSLKELKSPKGSLQKK